MKKLSFLSVVLVCYVSVSAQQWGSNGTHIYNLNTGNVGIRTNNPVHPFQVWDGGTNPYTGISLIPGNNPQGNSIISSTKANNYGLILRAESQNSGKGQAGVVIRNSDGSTIPSQVTLIGEQLDFRTGNNYHVSIEDGTPGNSALFINYGGQVGIGTTSPGSFKLAVEGKIGAREIKVTLQSPWPDYVFNQGYQRMSLASLEAFIKKNNHLPNIPSAQEVKENGGIELGEMNAKLLEKIEELTLYVIELKKENEEFRKQLEELKKRH